MKSNLRKENDNNNKDQLDKCRDVIYRGLLPEFVRAQNQIASYELSDYNLDFIQYNRTSHIEWYWYSFRQDSDYEIFTIPTNTAYNIRTLQDEENINKNLWCKYIFIFIIFIKYQKII